jgi:A/G-specific adenine glycosylase
VHILPTPKPRKAIPERKTNMLIYMNSNDIMLEKRANTGVWGGLWSFPEVETLPNNAQLLAKFTHTFTHFKLHIQPVLIKTAQQTNVPNTLWIALDEAIEAAIPTPVRKILQTLKLQKVA